MYQSIITHVNEIAFEYNINESFKTKIHYHKFQFRVYRHQKNSDVTTHPEYEIQSLSELGLGVQMHEKY